jgi:hypothetical protein
MTSAALTASLTSATFRPACSTLSQDAPPRRRPTVTLTAGFVQVLRVRMTLRTVADDGDVLAFDEGEVAVFVVENFHFIFLNILEVENFEDALAAADAGAAGTDGLEDGARGRSNR